MIVLKPSQVRRWFPDDDVLVVPSEVVDAVVTDAGARAVLSTVGVPESFLEVMELEELSSGIPTVRDFYAGLGEDSSPDGADLLYLGYLGEGGLALDGATGEVFQVRSGHRVRPLATSLEAFVRVLGAVSERWRKDGGASSAQLIHDAVAAVRKHDRSAPSAVEETWRAFLAAADAE